MFWQLNMLICQKGLALGCSVDLYEHGLQSATRCFRDLHERTSPDATGLTPAGLSAEDEELVVVALLHDIGETLSPVNHGEVAASVLRPYISPQNYWILNHHGRQPASASCFTPSLSLPRLLPS